MSGAGASFWVGAVWQAGTQTATIAAKARGASDLRVMESPSLSGDTFRAEQSSRKEGLERFIGRPDSTLERNRSIVAEMGAHRLVGKIHGKGQGSARAAYPHRGGDAAQDFERSLDRGGDAVDI